MQYLLLDMSLEFKIVLSEHFLDFFFSYLLQFFYGGNLKDFPQYFGVLFIVSQVGLFRMRFNFVEIYAVFQRSAADAFKGIRGKFCVLAANIIGGFACDFSLEFIIEIVVHIVYLFMISL